MTKPRDWDGPTYQRISAPLETMGRDVLDRLELAGDERVLDAGCGTGRVTAALLERLPHGRVIAVDGSPSMVEAARAALPADRVDLAVVDLLELDLQAPVDAVLSTATFHWIADHARLFTRLHGALTEGGRLVAQCGGEGNIARVRAAVDAVGHPALEGWPSPWRFAGPGETEARLRAAGFAEAWCWRQHVTVHPEDLVAYLATIVLGSHLERLPEADRAGFVGEVAQRLDAPEIDYVRLNLLARA